MIFLNLGCNLESCFCIITMRKWKMLGISVGFRKKVINVWGFLLGREICLYIYQKCFGIFVGLRNMFTPRRGGWQQHIKRLDFYVLLPPSSPSSLGCVTPPLIVLSPSIKQKIKKVHYLYAKISITIHRLTFDEEITLAWADTQTNPPQHIKITPHT